MSELPRAASGILVPVERWAAMVAFMNETANVAAAFADYGIERLDDLAGDPDCEDMDTDEDDDPREDDDPDCEHDGREPDTGGHCGDYGIDQSSGPKPPHGIA